MPGKYLSNYSTFGAYTNLSNVDEISTNKLTTGTLNAEDISVGGVSVEEIVVGGGIAVGENLNMDNKDIINVNKIEAQTISAVNYDYVNSQVHTVKDDVIVISKDGANETQIGTDANGLTVNKALTVNPTSDIYHKGSTLQSQLDNLQNQITSNDGDITTLQNTDVSLQNQITTNAGNITTNAGNITANANNITTLQNTDVSLQNQITTNAGNITTNANNITTLQNTDVSLQNQITTNAGNITTNANNITTLQNTDASLQNQITTNANDIAVLQGVATPALNDLTDVTITAVDNNDQIVWDGVKWINRPSSIHDAITIGTTGTGSKILTFRHDTNGNGDIEYCEGCDSFQMNKDLVGTDYKLGATSLKAELFDTTISVPGDTFNMGGTPNFWNNPVADFSSKVEISPCGCEIKPLVNLSNEELFGLSLLRTPGDVTGSLSGTNGTKYYQEFSTIGFTGANDRCYITGCLADTAGGYYGVGVYNFFIYWHPVTNSINFITADNNFGVETPSFGSGITTNVPGVGERMGVEFDFIADVVNIYNASTGALCYSSPQGLAPRWQAVKNGTLNFRIGCSAYPANIFVKIYTQADSLHYANLTGNKQYYMTNGYGSVGGGESYSIKFYDKPTIDASLLTKAEVADVYTKTQIDAQLLTKADTTHEEHTDILLTNPVDCEVSTTDANIMVFRTKKNVASEDMLYLTHSTHPQGKQANFNCQIKTSTSVDTPAVTLNGADLQTTLNSKITASSADTLTNKTIDGNNNTLLNIGSGSITNIDALKIGAGTVDNTQFGYLSGVNAPIQEQISNIVFGVSNVLGTSNTQYFVGVDTGLILPSTSTIQMRGGGGPDNIANIKLDPVAQPGMLQLDKGLYLNNGGTIDGAGINGLKLKSSNLRLESTIGTNHNIFVDSSFVFDTANVSKIQKNASSGTGHHLYLETLNDNSHIVLSAEQGTSSEIIENSKLKHTINTDIFDVNANNTNLIANVNMARNTDLQPNNNLSEILTAENERFRWTCQYQVVQPSGTFYFGTPAAYPGLSVGRYYIEEYKFYVRNGLRLREIETSASLIDEVGITGNKSAMAELMLDVNGAIDIANPGGNGFFKANQIAFTTGSNAGWTNIEVFCYIKWARWENVFTF